MSSILNLVKQVFSTIGAAIAVVWKLICFVSYKTWKFILAILAAIAGVLFTKRVSKEIEK